MAEPLGTVMTVCGPVAPENLGVTLMHEHLIVDFRRLFEEPESPEDREMSHQPVRLDNVSWVWRNWVNSLDNLCLLDTDEAVTETEIFKRAGGGTLVEVTNVGLGRDPLALRQISERAGVHVVMGCSYYHSGFHPEDMDDKSEDGIVDEIVRDIEEGVDSTGVRAGIIGEVGCNWPLHPNEEKVLRASARAARKTGTAISIHPGPRVESSFQIIDILEDAGADPERVVMGHMERSGFDKENAVRLASRGCYVEYDWFGQTLPTFPGGRVDVPSDGERISQIKHLIDAGFGKKIVVSQDVAMKMRLATRGGPGFSHIPRYVSRWMSAMGIGGQEIDDILINNPRSVLRRA